MAKAMMKRGTENQERVIQWYCPSCGEWDTRDNWTEHECVKIGRYERWSINDNDEDYITSDVDYSNIIIKQHDPCDGYFEQVIEERQRGGPTWVCGLCGWESRDKEAVMRCCL